MADHSIMGRVCARAPDRSASGSCPEEGVVEVQRLSCPSCRTLRLADDRFCRFCGRAFILPLVRAAAQCLIPMVSRYRPVPLWQGVALLALGASLTLARRWAVRRAVRALLPLLLARVLPVNGARPRSARIRQLTVTFSERIEER